MDVDGTNHLAVLVRDCRGHGRDAVRVLVARPGKPVELCASDARPDERGIHDRPRREPRKRFGQESVHVDRQQMGQQHDPRRGGVHRDPGPGPVTHAHRMCCMK